MVKDQGLIEKPCGDLSLGIVSESGTFWRIRTHGIHWTDPFRGVWMALALHVSEREK
jgi:hypothetical protein